MQTLIVWEEVPESTTLVALPREVYEKYKDKLDRAHGRYINSVDDEVNLDGAEFISAALAEKVEHVTEGGLQQFAGIFCQYIVDTKGAPIVGEFERVIISGFLL